jgi:hypothetical protein
LITSVSLFSGRGKTHVARRLGRYLEFFHAIPVRLYHAADYRRRIIGSNGIAANWFDPTNIETKELRTECIKTALRDMTKFLHEHTNGVAIFDSINETNRMRTEVINTVSTT